MNFLNSLNSLKTLRAQYNALPLDKRQAVLYTGATMGYGMVRKTAQLHNADLCTDEYDATAGKRVEKRVPVLMADKVWLTAISSLSSIYLWPFYVWFDMKQLEIYSRGLSPSDYDVVGKKRMTLDYLFC